LTGQRSLFTLNRILPAQYMQPNVHSSQIRFKQMQAIRCFSNKKGYESEFDDMLKSSAKPISEQDKVKTQQTTE